MAVKHSKPQRAVERMYQSAMNLRDSLPTGDFKAAEKREDKYRWAYYRAWLDDDVAEFRRATRRYRNGLRAAAAATSRAAGC